MALTIDRSGIASRSDPATFSSWAADQRVFISSVMGDLTPLRRGLATAVAEMGAEPVWFEAFGGRDDDAEVAYLSEVASSTICLGILGRDYGRLDRVHRLSATHVEYRQAERLGLPVSVWVRDEAEMHADQHNFLDEVQLFHTTGNFTNAEDLIGAARRRFEEMAAESVSPWAKLGEVVFRTRKIVDDGANLMVTASVHSAEVLHALESLRPTNLRSHDQRLTWAGRSTAVQVTGVQTTTTASRSSDVELTLERLEMRGPGSPFAMTASFSTGSRTFTSDDLAVLDMRHMLFGEENPSGLLTLGGSIRDFTTDLPSGPVTTSLYQALFSLLATEALLESGRAMRVNTAQVSSAGPDGRRVRLAWAGHTNRGDSSSLVSVEGIMPSL